VVSFDSGTGLFGKKEASASSTGVRLHWSWKHPPFASENSRKPRGSAGASSTAAGFLGTHFSQSSMPRTYCTLSSRAAAEVAARMIAASSFAIRACSWASLAALAASAAERSFSSLSAVASRADAIATLSDCSSSKLHKELRAEEKRGEMTRGELMRGDKPERFRANMGETPCFPSCDDRGDGNEDPGMRSEASAASSAFARAWSSASAARAAARSCSV